MGLSYLLLSKETIAAGRCFEDVSTRRQGMDLNVRHWFRRLKQQSSICLINRIGSGLSQHQYIMHRIRIKHVPFYLFMPDNICCVLILLKSLKKVPNFFCKFNISVLYALCRRRIGKYCFAWSLMTCII